MRTKAEVDGEDAKIVGETRVGRTEGMSASPRPHEFSRKMCGLVWSALVRTGPHMVRTYVLP